MRDIRQTKFVLRNDNDWRDEVEENQAQNKSSNKISNNSSNKNFEQKFWTKVRTKILNFNEKIWIKNKLLKY